MSIISLITNLLQEMQNYTDSKWIVYIMYKDVHTYLHMCIYRTYVIIGMYVIKITENVCFVTLDSNLTNSLFCETKTLIG